MPEWNHNYHYHKFILKNLSEIKESSLDIGSGSGFFASKLSLKFDKVTCLEPDNYSFNYAKDKYSSNSKMIHENLTLDKLNTKEKYNFISCIASIHHMDFESSLNKINELLSPHGKVVILGLYKESSFMDYFYTIIACIPNKIRCRLFRNASSENVIIKTKPATMTFKEIKYIADKILVNYKIKRHLYWRYSLVYCKPV